MKKIKDKIQDRDGVIRRDAGLMTYFNLASNDEAASIFGRAPALISVWKHRTAKKIESMSDKERVIFQEQEISRLRKTYFNGRITANEKYLQENKEFVDDTAIFAAEALQNITPFDRGESNREPSHAGIRDVEVLPRHDEEDVSYCPGSISELVENGIGELYSEIKRLQSEQYDVLQNQTDLISQLFQIVTEMCARINKPGDLKMLVDASEKLIRLQRDALLLPFGHSKPANNSGESVAPAQHLHLHNMGLHSLPEIE